ncbi:MAG: hypothetical protein ABSC90_12195 [Acidimicrobiales bacterium]|jgi:hypothetical protein
MPDSTQGLAGRSDHRARLRRDVALDRVGSITRKIVIGSIAGAAAIGFYVSRALPGHSARPASSGVAGSTPGTGGGTSVATVPASGVTGGSSTGADGSPNTLTPPTSPPSQTQQQAPVVSGST